jgi:hypothetical protein
VADGGLMEIPIPRGVIVITNCALLVGSAVDVAVNVSVADAAEGNLAGGV